MNNATVQDGVYRFENDDALVLVSQARRDHNKQLHGNVELWTPGGEGLLAAGEGKLGVTQFRAGLAKAAAQRNSGDPSRYDNLLLDIYMALQQSIPTVTSPVIHVDRMDTIAPQAVTWLWPKHFPGGKLSLLAGDPGVGKSYLTLDLAARISLGGEWPDRESNAPQGHVLLVSAEDGVGDTIRPRLDRLGAITSNITWIDATVRDQDRDVSFSLADHLRQLESLIVGTEAMVLILDPLLAFMGAGKDTYKTAQVRSVLAPLAAMAERTQCAVLAIMHLNKRSDESKSVYRLTNSLDFAAAARAVFIVGQDPGDEDKRILAPAKCNLSAPPTPLRFHITLEGDFAWDGEAPGVGADAVLGTTSEDRSQRQEAIAFFEDLLTHGPIESKLAMDQGVEQGLSTKTLYRARKDLGVISEPIGIPGKQGGKEWWLRLPQ